MTNELIVIKDIKAVDDLHKDDPIYDYWNKKDSVMAVDDSVTNKYLVHIKMRIGEYEKCAHSVVIANSDREAVIAALLNQCHNEPEIDPDYTSIDAVFWDDGMAYSATSVKALTEQEYQTLKTLNLA